MCTTYSTIDTAEMESEAVGHTSRIISALCLALIVIKSICEISIKHATALVSTKAICNLHKLRTLKAMAYAEALDAHVLQGF
jgi:hypothetical protein